MTKALVVLSGGQDSTYCLYHARAAHDDVCAITFDYNQRHRREVDSAVLIARMAGVTDHEVIYVGGALLKSTSPLTMGSAELETYEDHASMEKIIGDRIEKTFVPMRNALFLTIAANRAVALGCNEIYTGICAADNANYPDCTDYFRNSMEEMINEALGNTIFANLDGTIHDRRTKWIDIHAPLMNMSKAQSVRAALTLPGCYEALGHSHTAYDGQFPPVSKDHASVLRAHGFKEAAIPDPLVVRAYWEGLMELPNDAHYHMLYNFITDTKNNGGLQALEETLRSLINKGVL